MKAVFTNKISKNTLLIYPLFEKTEPKHAAVRLLVQNLAKTKEFKAAEGRMFFSFGAAKSLPAKILLLGLGHPQKLTVPSLMSAFGAAIKTAGDHRPAKITVVLPPALFPFAQAVAEAVALGNYQPSAPYKTGKALKKLHARRIKNLEIVGLGKNTNLIKSFKKGLAIGDAVNETRDWVNAPPNFANTDFFERKAKEIADGTAAKLTVFRKKEIEKLGMGGLLGVNRGSPDEPRLIILDYQPKETPNGKNPIVLVGKGVIFDSGGYNLKPQGHIEDMQLDKAGAAAVLSLIKLLPELAVKRRVIAVLPFTENLIGERTLKPSEILRTYAGKTVEITNTDGEGRLILADAIAYAVEQFKPEYLIDIATLTGACVVALGDRYAGLFGNDAELMEKLKSAGSEVDELLWPMPLHKDHGKKMKGQYADLRNADIGSEHYAGASKGAAFIQEFVGKTKWAHLDIAGPAFTKDPKKYEHKGATGFGLRVLAQFLKNL